MTSDYSKAFTRIRDATAAQPADNVVIAGEAVVLWLSKPWQVRSLALNRPRYCGRTVYRSRLCQAIMLSPSTEPLAFKTTWLQQEAGAIAIKMGTYEQPLGPGLGLDRGPAKTKRVLLI
jgi:hypothetical protein